MPENADTLPRSTNPVALTIAGSDPSGGAGLQADLKTFHRFGVYGTAVISLLTVQNTVRVSAVEPLPAKLVLAQLDAVLEDIPPAAAKTGALGSREIVEAVAERARSFTFPLVVDPVMISKHGQALLQDDARQAVIEKLLATAFLVTPNVPEAAALSGIGIADAESMERAGRAIAARGPQAVLIKGGHLRGEAVDLLLYQDKVFSFSAPRLEA
ncbi:MAG TPA: bifunctional hydroxymethylpyrimidine kinase/phosphomethylpyrimidine kinase, partial [Terriglobia bacterium]|nr:bifunctional hydroxymethylpyrimidine kinase/phosphomethylpyrimidine kinase [Terriglobia bacterium]